MEDQEYKIRVSSNVPKQNASTEDFQLGGIMELANDEEQRNGSNILPLRDNSTEDFDVPITRSRISTSSYLEVNDSNDDLDVPRSRERRAKEENHLGAAVGSCRDEETRIGTLITGDQQFFYWDLQTHYTRGPTLEATNRHGIAITAQTKGVIRRKCDIYIENIEKGVSEHIVWHRGKTSNYQFWNSDEIFSINGNGVVKISVPENNINHSKKWASYKNVYDVHVGGDLKYKLQARDNFEFILLEAESKQVVMSGTRNDDEDAHFNTELGKGLDLQIATCVTLYMMGYYKI
jgi:hypothetical protein